MNEKWTNLLKNRDTRIILASTLTSGVVCYAVGFATGYILGRRPKRESFDYEAAKASVFTPEELAHIEEIKQRHSETVVIVDSTDNSLKGMEFVQEKLGTVIEPMVQPETIEEDTSDAPFHRSIFDDVDDVWDWEREVNSRNEEEPYIIHKEEFYNNERDYTQTTLTYYAGDDILVDEEESPVYNHNSVVGQLIFGHGSGGDPNVVHVRNPKLHAEYEILLDTGLYSVEVLGLEIENNDRVKNLKPGGYKRYKAE